MHAPLFGCRSLQVNEWYEQRQPRYGLQRLTSSVGVLPWYRNIMLWCSAYFPMYGLSAGQTHPYNTASGCLPLQQVFGDPRSPLCQRLPQEPLLHDDVRPLHNTEATSTELEIAALLTPGNGHGLARSRPPESSAAVTRRTTVECESSSFFGSMTERMQARGKSSVCSKRRFMPICWAHNFVLCKAVQHWRSPHALGVVEWSCVRRVPRQAR